MKSEISLAQSNVLQDIAEKTIDEMSKRLIESFIVDKVNTTREDCMLTRHDNQYLTGVAKMSTDEDTKQRIETYINDFTKAHT